MNRYAHPNTSRRTVFFDRVHPSLGRPGLLKGPKTEGQLIAQIIHGFYLDDRTRILVSCRTGSQNDAHLERLEEFVKVLGENGFLVRLHYESPNDSSTGTYRRIYRVRKPVRRYVEGLASHPVVKVGSSLSLPASLLHIYLLVSIARVESLQIEIASVKRWTHTAKWISQFARSLGLQVTNLESTDRYLRLDLTRAQYVSVGWPMDEFIRYREWTALAHSLFKAMRGGIECDLCGSPTSGRSARYHVGWIPIDKGANAGQLILTEGFEREEYRNLASQVGGEILGASEGRATMLVPASAWGATDSLLILKPTTDIAKSFQVLERIPPPPGFREIVNGPELEEDPEEGSVPIRLVPLGGGQEIGANSYLIQIGSRRILLDCGLDISDKDRNPMGLPALELVDNLDAIILTHAHTDHTGSILMAHSLFPNTPIYCTPETSVLMRMMLAHHTSSFFLQKTAAERGFEIPAMSYWDDSFLDMLREVPTDRQIGLPGLPGALLRFVPAGHILGAAAIELFLGDRRILYTGDFCLRDQLTVDGSRIDAGGHWDTLIIESTYGSETVSEALDAETATEKLCGLIAPTIAKNGRVLLPAFAIGKSQELFAMLIRGMRSGLLPGLKHDQILIGGLANPFFDVYGHYAKDEDLKKYLQAASSVNAMPEDLEIESAVPAEPIVYIATHGMMIPGTKSFELAIELLEKEHASIVITGYQALNAPGRTILEASRGGHRPSEVEIGGKRRRLKADLRSVRISGHATFDELMKTVQSIAPRRLIVVHGDSHRVKNLIQKVGESVPSVLSIGPVNRQPVDLGFMSVREGDLAEWQAQVGVKIPDAREDIPLRQSPGEAEWKGFFITSTDAEVKKVRGEDNVYEAYLNPRVYPKALILLESRRPISSLTRLKVTSIGGEGREPVDRDKESLQDIRSLRYRLELGPGKYRIESEVEGKEWSQELRVLLDMEESAEDWSFDKDGDLNTTLSLLPVHLRHLESIRLVRERGVEVDAGVSWEVSQGRIQLEIHKNLEQHGRALLQFDFRNGVVAKDVTIHLGDEDPSSADIQFDHPGSVVLPGTVLGIRANQRGSVIRTVSAVSGQGQMIVVSSPPQDWEVTFTDPGKYSVEVQFVLSTGFVKYFEEAVEVAPSAFPSSPLPNVLLPGRKVTISLQVQHPNMWSDLRMEVGGTELEHQVDGAMITTKLVPTFEQDQKEFRLTGTSFLVPGTSVSLFTRTLNVGLGIELDEKRSHLILDESRRAEVWFKSAPTDGQLENLLEMLDLEILQLSEGAEEVGHYRFQIRDSLWKTLESAKTWIPTGFRGVDLLNLQKLELKLVSGSQPVGSGSRIRGENPVAVSVTPSVRSGGQLWGSNVVCVKTSPLLEWTDLRRFEGGWEVVLKGPGEYKVTILHHGKVAVEHDFQVLPREDCDTTLAKPSPTHFGRTYTSLPDLRKAVAEFMEQNQNTPPSVIGFRERDQIAVFNGPHASMARTLEKHLTGQTDDTTVFVVPSNSVPSYLSESLFSLGEPWIALSYPSPRDLKSTNALQFVRMILKSSRDFSASIRQIRRVETREAADWTPGMAITCPDCGKIMKAAITETPPVTRCDCGFESPDVGYSLEELRSGHFKLIVMQYNLYTYVMENLQKELGGSPPKYTFLAGLEILRRESGDPFDYQEDRFPIWSFPGVAPNLDPEMTVFSLINSAYRRSPLFAVD